MHPILSKHLFYYPITFLRGERVQKYLKAYEKRQWESHDAIVSYQKKKLKELLYHAYKTTPYYQKLFDEAGLVLDKNMSAKQIFKQFNKLPILTKSILVDHSDQIYSIKKQFFNSNKTTGGSTGQAVSIRKNASALARERASTWRAYGWAGVGIGDIQARFWGTAINTKGMLLYKAIDYVSNRVRLSAFHMNKDSLNDYYLNLQELKPAYLYGYVSMIVAFAEFILANQFESIKNIKAVITTSEVLDKNSRQLIETAFNVKVFNEYGCGEVGSIAHECEYGNMHIMDDNVFVEIDTSESPDGKSGQIIITDLHNYAMPLIRYSVGDYATLSDEVCACGRGLSIIQKIHGRAYDIIRDPDGNTYHPEILMYIFEEMKAINSGIKQFQVIQKRLDELQINLISEKNNRAQNELMITNLIKTKVHPAFKLEFNYLNEIKREKSGKLRVIKSELHDIPKAL